MGHAAVQNVHGDHACFAYTSVEARRQAVTKYLRTGLLQNEKLFFVAPEPEERLQMDILFPEAQIESLRRTGRLAVIATEDAYLPGGAFDADARLGAYDVLVSAALREGFTGLRVAADATQVVLHEQAMETFASYELRAGMLAQRLPFAALCLYDRRACSGDAIEELHAVHPRNIEVGHSHPRFRLYPKNGRLVLAGDVDVTIADSVYRLLVAAGRDSDALALDLSDVSFIDVAGMRALIRAARASGREAVVLDPSLAFMRLWDVLGGADMQALRVERAL